MLPGAVRWYEVEQPTSVGHVRTFEKAVGRARQGQQRDTDQGFHMVVGTPASALPTSGTVQYLLAGATAPTIGDGSVAPGGIAGTIGVDFAAARVGLDLSVGIGGFDYAMKTPGGSLDPANGGFALQA